MHLLVTRECHERGGSGHAMLKINKKLQKHIIYEVIQNNLMNKETARIHRQKEHLFEVCAYLERLSSLARPHFDLHALEMMKPGYIIW